MKYNSKEIVYSYPSKSELEILQVLWDNGPLSVRSVNELLNKLVRNVQYSSTLKTMQIMADKKLVIRDERQMQHIYKPATCEAKTKEQILHRFVDTIYKGSSANLMIHLLGSKKPATDELEQIRNILSKLGKK